MRFCSIPEIVPGRMALRKSRVAGDIPFKAQGFSAHMQILCRKKQKKADF